MVGIVLPLFLQKGKPRCYLRMCSRLTLSGKDIQLLVIGVKILKPLHTGWQMATALAKPRSSALQLPLP